MKLQDIAISGTGTIDGQGSPWWPFAKTKGVELALVPKANHLFIEGEGVSKPAEYGKPGHVAQSVIERIVGFTGR